MEECATNFTLETLARLAATFRTGLVVKFVPYSEMLRWENSFSTDAFNVVRIEEDQRFLDPTLAREPAVDWISTRSVAATQLPEFGRGMDQDPHLAIPPRGEQNTRVASGDETPIFGGYELQRVVGGAR